MIHRIYTVFDKKAEAFLPPFYLQTHGQALRAFKDACTGQNDLFTRHPEDVSLVFLGTFDDSNGCFAPEGPTHVWTGIEAAGSGTPSLKAASD